MGNKKFALKLIGLEVLDFYLPKPIVAHPPGLEINFNLSVDSQVIEQKRTIINRPTLVLEHKQNPQTIFGSLTIAVSFEVENFDDIGTRFENGKFDIDYDLDKSITVVSLDTLRGIAFTMFRPTYLANIILPFFDPDQLIRTKI